MATSFDLPVPQESKIMLSLAGFQHTSPYTNTVIASITYGSRRVWRASYVWDIAKPEITDQLESFLLRASSGQTTVPLYFFGGTSDGLRRRFDSQTGTIATQPSIEIEYTNVISGLNPIDRNIIHFRDDDSFIVDGSPFGVRDNYNLQIGRFCLRVTGWTRTSITVANMPVDPISGQSNLLERLIPGNTVRNFDFFMIGKNVSFEVGHGETRNASGAYLPDPVEFLEVF